MDALQKSTKIYQHNTDVGDLGIPEIYPLKELKGQHENSVDAICVNPLSDKEFSSASHDHTIKIWDAYTCNVKMTLKGHSKGVWSLGYDLAGLRLISASPDSQVKIWDAKTGKCQDTLKGHSHFCYKAVFSNDGQNAASVGADKILNYWDLRNTKTPLFQNQESQNCLMSCDFLTNDQQIVTTSIEGEISIFSVKRGKRVFYHETLPQILQDHKENHPPAEPGFEHLQANPLSAEKLPTNIMYCVKSVRGVPNDEGVFLVGAQDKNVTKIQVDFNEVKTLDMFSGHSMGIRSIELSQDGQKLATGCEDHSLRIWDYQSCKAKQILSGHHDVVSGGAFLNPNLLVSSSWDMTIKLWKI